jgi:hypothetical protein
MARIVTKEVIELAVLFAALPNYKSTRTGRQRLFPAGTVLAGKQVQRT